MVMFSDVRDTKLSLREAAVLSGTSEKAIRHELAARVVRPRRSGGRRRFNPGEVLYFFLVKELPVDLNKRLRSELFELLSTDKARAGKWRREAHRLVLDGALPVILPMDDFVKRADARIRAFLRGRSRLSSRPEVLGGEAAFEGTRISVRFVGERALAGESLETLLEDYPALTSEDVEFARMFVALGPPPGRPKRKVKFVRGEG